MASYDRDYVTTLPLLKDKANEYSEERWNRYEDDLGETLLKFLACTSHTVDYYFRRYLDSLLLPNDDWTAKNLVWELTGFKPPYIRADYLMIQLYWPDCGLLSYVPLFMYTPFKVTADGKEYTFLVAEDYLIPPMTTKINVRLVQGALVQTEVDYTKVTDCRIKVSDNAIDYDLVTLEVSGEKWTQVRNVFYSPNTEKIFSLHREEDGIWMYLHKSWKDQVDEYNPNMMIYYIESDTSFDDVTEDCMSIAFSGPLLDTAGVDVSPFYRIFPLTNTEATSDLQPSTTEGDRVLTTNDYTEKASNYPGVATAKAYSWDNSAVTRNPFEVNIVVTGPNGILRDRTKDNLKAYLKSIGSPLIEVNVIDPVYIQHIIQVVVDIGDVSALTQIQIRLAIKAKFEEYYALGNMEPGYEVTIKELNSLALRADSRIYYADCSFISKGNYSPIGIPVLKRVDVLTEASALILTDVGVCTEWIQAANALFRNDEGFFDDVLNDITAAYDRIGDGAIVSDHLADINYSDIFSSVSEPLAPWLLPLEPDDLANLEASLDPTNEEIGCAFEIQQYPGTVSPATYKINDPSITATTVIRVFDGTNWVNIIPDEIGDGYAIFTLS